MKKQTIINIIEFMKRASLRGEEVQAYNECTIELNELLILEMENEKPEQRIDEKQGE